MNVSSPNTPGLRDLESKARLSSLLARLTERRDAAAARIDRSLPLLVKLSPDLDRAEIAGVVEAIESSGGDGIILTNTTTTRPGLTGGAVDEEGGLSGAPLGPLSLSALRFVRGLTDLPLVSVGGIMSAADAAERLEAGASLVQVFTGFVYQGPALVRSIAALAP